jgi:hypothetical protein
MASEPLWDTWSNELFPKNLESALYYANWLRTRNGDLVSAIKRGICYFLNGVEIASDTVDMDSKDLYIDKLEKEHKILQQILAASLDLQFYGNSFTSVARSITRALVCPRCGAMRYLRNLSRGVDYDFTKGKFTSTCSSCKKYKGEMRIQDFIDYSAEKELMVMSWSPLAISLDHCPITGAEKITYIPTENVKSFVEDESESAALESLPNCLLQALSDDKAVEFKNGGCLHLVLPRDSMNSDELKGWGLPGFLPAFKYIVMLMLLERQTEAAVKDFMLPIRLLFPAPSTSRGGSDPISMAGNSLHMGEFRSTVERALRSQARHQASWQLIPAPVEQLQLGGDGKAVAPVELLQYAKDNLLDCYCIPTEFARTQFTGIGGIPAAALKNFEQTWEPEVNQMELYLNWYLKNCNQLLGWPDFKGELMRQSISTDPARMQFMSAMNQAGLISNTTMMRAMNINPKQERARLIEDQINQNKLQMEIEDRIKKEGIVYSFNQQNLDMNVQQAQEAAMGGGQGGAGAPPAADPSAQGGAMPPPMPGMSTGNPMMDIQNLPSVRTPNSVSPDQLQADAQVVAQILMHAPIGSARNQIYSAVKGMNRTLYDIAKSLLQGLENQAKQQGVEMARQGAM